MRTRRVCKFTEDDGTGRMNVVFFGVKGVTSKGAVTVDGVTYSRSVFWNEEEYGWSDIESGDDSDVTDEQGVLISEGVSYDDSDSVSEGTSSKIMLIGDSDLNPVADADSQKVGYQETVKKTSDHTSYADGSEGTLQSLFQRLSVLQGEMLYYPTYGFPITQKNRDPQLFDAYLLDTLLNHPDITQVTDFSSQVKNHDYLASFSAVTVYGAVSYQYSRIV